MLRFKVANFVAKLTFLKISVMLIVILFGVVLFTYFSLEYTWEREGGNRQIKGCSPVQLQKTKIKYQQLFPGCETSLEFRDPGVFLTVKISGSTWPFVYEVHKVHRIPMVKDPNSANPMHISSRGITKVRWHVESRWLNWIAYIRHSQASREFNALIEKVDSIND